MLPDENNVARLQEELKAMKLRESEAMKCFRELQQQVKELNDNWQVCSTIWIVYLPSFASLTLLGKFRGPQFASLGNQLVVWRRYGVFLANRCYVVQA